MKRYANMRLLAAVALLIAAAGCKEDEGPTLGQPALLSIQDATADAEVITVESPKKQTLDIRVEAEQIRQLHNRRIQDCPRTGRDL